MREGADFELEASEPRATQKRSRTFILDGVGPVQFEKPRRARRISLTVRASRGVRVAVPWRCFERDAMGPFCNVNLTNYIIKYYYAFEEVSMAIHEEVLLMAQRICRERGEMTFRVADVVHALPHLKESSVRTHIVSRCCVNAPINHPHKWPYFRRLARGEYEILPTWQAERKPRVRVEESPAAYAKPSPPHDTIHVAVRRSAGFYVAEGLELALVTQGRSLDELVANLKKAIQLHLEGEEPGVFGLTRSPRIALTYEEHLSGDDEA